MKSRTMTALLIAAAVALGTSGCASTPEPPEETTAAWTEAEAFAAAEETYRAYVDALNQVDLSDPDTFEAVYAWTTGDANTGERESLSRMHAEGWTVSGESKVESIELSKFHGENVLATTCLFVDDVELADASGASQVSATRPSAQSQAVEFTSAEASPTGFLISSIAGAEGSC